MHDEFRKTALRKRNRIEATCTECGKGFRTADPVRTTCSKICRQQSWRNEIRDATISVPIAPAPAKLESTTPDVREKEGTHETRSGQADTGGASLPITTPTSTPEPMADVGSENDAWLQRAQYWEGVQKPSPRMDLQRAPRPVRSPLILNGHGVRLRIDHGALLIRNGFTHYPQKSHELRFFPGDPALPSRIIGIDSDGSVSLDVIRWLAEQGVPMILLNWQGEVESVMSEQGPFDPDLRRAQVEAVTNGKGLELGRQLIRSKIQGCQQTLLTLWKTPGREETMRKLHIALEELETMPATVEEIRMIEARAALAYFTHWQEVGIHWKGTGRKPIPPEWQRVGLRKGVLGSMNRHAAHPVAAILNYAYAVLESQVRIAATAQGLDPTIGYLHARRPGRVALVYDLMEPWRPRVDALILQLLRGHVFAPSDFLVDRRGSCRIHPQLARVVARLGVSHTEITDHMRSIVVGVTK